MMIFPIVELIQKAWMKCMDYFMYLTYWHPVNHKIWFEIYRDIPMFDKRAWKFSDWYHQIDIYKGRRLAKVDAALGIIRSLILFTGACLFILWVIKCKG